MKFKKMLVILGISIIILAGVIKLNYSKIAWLVYPEKYAQEVLPYPELETSVIKKDDKSYLYIQSMNCPWSTYTFNNTLIYDEKTLSFVIQDYKLDTFSMAKGFEGKYDDRKLLIEIKDNNPITQKLVCVKVLPINRDLERYRGARETEIKLENGKINIKKI